LRLWGGSPTYLSKLSQLSQESPCRKSHPPDRH
jgi:hypothetical protein